MNMLKKTLLATAMVAASASAFAGDSCGGTSYTVTTTTAAVATKLGTTITPIPDITQRFLLDHTDCTFVSTIYPAGGDPDADMLFLLTGSWAYPTGAPMIYLALDGDVAQGFGGDPDTSWGRLHFSSPLNLDVFMNILYSGDGNLIVQDSFSVVPAGSVSQKGTITPGKVAGTATTAFAVKGRAESMVTQTPDAKGNPRPNKPKMQNWGLESIGTAATMTAGI